MTTTAVHQSLTLGWPQGVKLTLPRHALCPRAATQAKQTRLLTDVHVCLLLALHVQTKEQLSATPDTSNKQRRKLSCKRLLLVTAATRAEQTALLMMSASLLERMQRHENPAERWVGC
jgi:hypothetical protein